MPLCQCISAGSSAHDQGLITDHSDCEEALGHTSMHELLEKEVQIVGSGPTILEMRRPKTGSKAVVGGLLPRASPAVHSFAYFLARWRAGMRILCTLQLTDIRRRPSH